MSAPTKDRSVRFNYVTPGPIYGDLKLYCEQNLISPSKLVRKLILEYIEGDRELPEHPEHPSGHRTSVSISERLLGAFEQKIEEDGHSTKAAVIAALLAQFLPGRILSKDAETVGVEVDVPAPVFSVLYERYGPGPLPEVFAKALTHLADMVSPCAVKPSKLTKESV